MANRIKLCTYNVLADKYATSGYHSYCPDRFLPWHVRGAKLLGQLKAQAADVLFLQEVEEQVFDDEWRPALDKFGYEGTCQMRDTGIVKGPREGCAMFWRRSMFATLHQEGFQFRQHMDPQLPPDQGTVQEAKRRVDGAVLAVLQHISSGTVMVACGVHLFWDPKWPDVKVLQAHTMCQRVQHVMSARQLSIDTTPVIFGGDFNSMWRKYASDPFDQLPAGVPHLTSGVYDLLDGGTLLHSHQDHPNNRGRAGPSLVEDFPHLTTGALKLLSVHMALNGQEPPLTHKTGSFTATLDYIWVSPHLHVLSVAPMPYETQGTDPGAFPAIPNEEHPSDHLPLACEVELKVA